MSITIIQAIVALIAAFWMVLTFTVALSSNFLNAGRFKSDYFSKNPFSIILGVILLLLTLMLFGTLISTNALSLIQLVLGFVIAVGIQFSFRLATLDRHMRLSMHKKPFAGSAVWVLIGWITTAAAIVLLFFSFAAPFDTLIKYATIIIPIYIGFLVAIILQIFSGSTLPAWGVGITGSILTVLIAFFVTTALWNPTTVASPPGEPTATAQTAVAIVPSATSAQTVPSPATNETLTGPTPSSGQMRIAVRDALNDLFTVSDLKNLCFNLDVPYDQVASENKGDTVLRLIEYMDDRSQLNRLVDEVRRQRPNAKL